MQDIEAIAKQARIVSFNAQVIAARGGGAGDTPAATASELALDSAYGELSAECEPIQ